MPGKPRNSAATSFGRQMKKMRLSRGWTLRETAARTGIDFTTVSRVENGKRPPSEAIAHAYDEIFPELRGWFAEFYDSSRTWMPPGFRDWPEIEDKAETLRAWTPSFLHGLLQTEAYALAQLRTAAGATPEMISARLANRMERQRRVLLRDEPPSLWFLVDELALYRRVGSAEVMAAQCARLAEVAARPSVTMQVLPAVEHPAGASGFIVTETAGYTETVLSGQVFSDPQTVTALNRMFNTILAEAYRASESRARFERMAEIWAHGASRATATPTAATA